MVLQAVLILCSLQTPVPGQAADPLPPEAVGRLGSGRLQHSVEIEGLAFSSDGLRLATLGHREGVHVWEAKTGLELGFFPAADAFAVAYSEQGHLQMLRLSKDQVVWQDLDDGRELFRAAHGLGRTDTIRGRIRSSSFAFTDGLTGPRVLRQGKLVDAAGDKNWMWTLELSPTGEHLAAAEQHLRIWRTSGEPVVDVPRHDRNTWAVRFSPDGRLVASGGNKDLCLSDLAGKELLRIPVTSEVRSFAFTPDGKILAAGVGSAIHLFDAGSGAELRKLVGHPETVMHLEFSPDGKRLASAERGCTAAIWDVATGGSLVERPGHQGRITSMSLSPDGKRLATASVDRTVRVWDLAARRQLLVMRDSDRVHHVFFTPDGKTLLSQGSGVRLWDAETGASRESKITSDKPERVDRVLLSPDGARLIGIVEPVIVPGAGTMFLWDVASGQQLLLYHWSSREHLSATFSPEGRVLATSGGGNIIEFWDAATGQRLREDLTIADHWIYALAFSPDGKTLACATGNHKKEPTVRLLDSRTGATVQTLGKEDDPSSSIAFSGDGRFLATAGHGSLLKVWELDTGSEVFTAQVERPMSWDVSFGSDSRTVILRTYTATRILDMAKGAEVLRLPPGDPLAIADGLIARTDGASVLLYRIPRPEREIDRDAHWEDLKDKDAAKAGKAMWSLGTAKGASPFLQGRLLSECTPPEESLIRDLVRKLGSDEIDARARAFDRLAFYGDEIGALLRKLRDEGLSEEARARVDTLLRDAVRGKSARLLRRLRTIQSLEMSGDAATLNALLEKLPTEEERGRAREAIARLRSR